MEAADDIGYATGDIEDVLKKGFVDFGSIHECLSTAQSKESKECVEKFLDEPYRHDFKKIDLERTTTAERPAVLPNGDQANDEVSYRRISR